MSTKSKKQQSTTEDRFLQRGEHAAPDTIAAGPSVVFGESATTALGDSPLPSQRVLSEGRAPVVLSRQRPRFQTVQDLDVALHQAIEGKITAKNAWASREASDLLEGIIHTIESTLEGAGSNTDDYSGFAKAATVVEGCSKVWTSRVDSTYMQSNQMVRRLLRNDNSVDEGNEGEQTRDGEDGEDGDARPQKKLHSNRSRVTARTLAVDTKEINLDSKSKTSLTLSGMNAQFRAITEKFDQGNAHGLLVHNAPLGSAGNYILDVDYSRQEGPGRPLHDSRRGSKGSRRHSTHAPAGAEGEEIVGRLTLPAPEEEDLNVNMQVDDLPAYEAPIVATTTEEAAAQRNSARRSDKSSAPSQRGSMMVDPLLALPPVKVEERQGLSQGGSRRGSPTRADGSAGQQQQQTNGQPPPQPQTATEEADENDWDMGGGGDWGDDGHGLHGEEEEEGGQNESALDVGRAARQLVSGADAMAQVDHYLSSHAQLALEAEDPSDWCPLTQQPTSLFGSLAGRGELSQLRRNHLFSAGAPAPSQRQPGSPAGAAKRTKKEKTVVFDLPEKMLADPTEELRLLQREAAAKDNDNVLKQSTTSTKFLTPLGKELVVGRDAPEAVVRYTQSAVQRHCAEEAGLLLPQPPVTGETIPSHLPYPVEINSFFQVFSTALPQWNLLRKSASGQLIHARPSASGARQRYSDGSAASIPARRDTGTGDADGYGGLQDMPVEFFPGGAETDDYYGDGGDGPGDDYDEDADVYKQNMQLVAQFDAQHAAQAMAAPSARSTTHSELTLMEPLEMAKVLQPQEVTVPNQVDVVQLRETMWHSLQQQVQQNRFISTEGIEDPRHKEGGTNDAGGRRQRSPPPQAMLKQHAAKVLLERRENAVKGPRGLGGKRGRGEGSSDGEESEEEESRSQTPTATASKAARMEDLPHFTDVVRGVLPAVPSISSTGTLSPAFFFFSMLFLANEHNVLLENVESLDDMVVRGFVQCIV